MCHSRTCFPTIAIPVALSLVLSMTLAAESFTPVERGYTMVFPLDHGAHPGFRIEWWYFTGFLELDASAADGAADGETRSFQITFFRYRPEPGGWSENPSRFAPRQIIMAHAALGDAATQRFQHWQRVGRVGIGLAHARPGRLDVKVQDWSLSAHGDVWRGVIEFDEQRWELDFSLPGDPLPVMHGNAGLSAKGAATEQASYYYSYPTMAVSGALIVEGRRTAVRGRAWMDHEWSSEPLDPDARGWDWVGLRLDDGGALMVYRFRDSAGGQRFIGGTWVTPLGAVHPLAAGDVTMTPGSRLWRSGKTGASYPLSWTIVAPPGRLKVDALFPNQEMVTSLGPRYWEGAVHVSGDVGGEGFLEMTGYAASGGTPASGP